MLNLNKTKATLIVALLLLAAGGIVFWYFFAARSPAPVIPLTPQEQADKRIEELPEVAGTVPTSQLIGSLISITGGSLVIQAETDGVKHMVSVVFLPTTSQFVGNRDLKTGVTSMSSAPPGHRVVPGSLVEVSTQNLKENPVKALQVIYWKK